MAVKKIENANSFETQMKKYLNQGREKLSSDLAGTREAIKLIAQEKTRDFIQVMDKGLDKNERAFLRDIIVASMYQSFCYGYGIGKIEGTANNKIFL